MKTFSNFVRIVYVIVKLELIERLGAAINEAITNTEDKLESNKAVKMISVPERYLCMNLNESDAVHIYI